MSSARELRRHIKSVKSTRQITKAMEMVASAKMRRATSAALASRPYTEHCLAILRNITSAKEQPVTHELLSDRPIKTVYLFIISSDRGFAGSYNSLILRQVVEFIREQCALGYEVKLITMGQKVERALAHLGYSIEQSYNHTPTHPSLTDIAPISGTLIEHFRDGSCDAAYILYTHYYTALKQTPTVQQVLPLNGSVITKMLDDHPIAEVQEFLFEPSPVEVLDTILPRLVEVQMFQYLEEALASEHAARRLAMNSATDNADSLIERLELTYNGIRQASITQELAEITGGAAALNS